MINVHPPSACEGRGCPVHHPSDHAMQGWPVVWNDDLQCCRRMCGHHVRHPDPDDVAYHDSIGRDLRAHACDGCCTIRAAYDHEVAVQTIAETLRAATSAGADLALLLVEAVALATAGLDPARLRDDPVSAGIELASAGLKRIARAGGDVAEAVAVALVRAASAVGGVDALLAGRPGSWEAAAIRELLAGTVADEEAEPIPDPPAEGKTQ